MIIVEFKDICKFSAISQNLSITRAQAYKTFLRSTQLCMKFIMLKAKMQTIVGILTYYQDKYNALEFLKQAALHCL